MTLPEGDENYLNEKGFAWELIPEGQSGFLVIKDYPLHPDRYDREQVDLMIRIPAGYNNAGLDMFYVEPSIRLRAGGFPPAAEVFEAYAGRTWQRFSRHLVGWRAGLDGLPMFLSLIQKELQS